jgi:predicted ATPase
MTNRNLHVITGGPGSGKTTLLEELSRRGFHCVPEVARQIISGANRAGRSSAPLA